MELENIHVILPLFHCACPSQAGELTERTSTGHRCWIVSCIDLGNGFHHYHTNLCNSAHVLQHSVTSAQSSSVNSSSAPPDSLHVPISTMVRHRMRSRRGGTRGGSSRSPALHSHNSASPASSAENPHQYSFASQCPNTRSDRGRAGLNNSRCEEAVVRSATFPLPLHQVPHAMQFRFRSSLNYLVIVATVSISITEDTKPYIPMTISMEETHRVGPSRNRGNQDEQEGDGGRNRRHGKAIADNSHDEMGIQSDTQAVESHLDDTSSPQFEAGSREEGHQVVGRGESDNPDDGACPIVEEPALEDLATCVASARWNFF